MKNNKLSVEMTNSYNCLVVLSMLFMSVMLCNAILTNRYIGNNEFYILGGTLTSPYVFILGDVIAEVYGCTVARKVILSGLLAQSIFVLVCQAVTSAPSPRFFHDYEMYSKILGENLLWIVLSNCVSYVIANFINTHIIQKWKTLVKGEYYWMRSIGSSVVAEALYSLLAIFMMEFYSMPTVGILKLLAVSFLIKVIHSAFFAYPTSLIVNRIKLHTGTDVYDFPIQVTPQKYNLKQEVNYD